MDVFAALADPVRRSLLQTIAAAPSRVVDLADSLPISRPAVSKHLRLLAEAGLVTVEERGRERHYGLRIAGLGPVRDLLSDLAHPAWPTTSALDALDTEVRRAGRDRRTSQEPDRHEETA